MTAVHTDVATVDLQPLVAGLRRPECYPHPVRRVRVIETHISWVLLTGAWAYKVKKPVNLGFLDFSTPEARRHFCEEELRLNRRLAPQIYDAVVEIRGSPERPRIGGSGPLLEYAVKMREFAQDALADRMLTRRAFGPPHVDQLADAIARFHAVAAVAGEPLPCGTPEGLLAPALQNCEQILAGLTREADRNSLQSLRRWTEREHAARREEFRARRQQGCVRECHGDLHLGNIAVIDGHPIAFDCIEFSDTLRWIDVMSETGFLLMDLEDRERSDLAWRFLNRYLEATGDYAGLGVLRFYLVYRALVRAKVNVLRARQPHLTHKERHGFERLVREYLKLAERFTAPHAAALVITHGVSSAGKTTATQSLIELAEAVRVRSDVERKRLHGLAAFERSGTGLASGIYSRQATAATYNRLLDLAHGIVQAGYPAVVDATFLQRARRDAFRALASQMRVPFLILDFAAPEPILRERVARRLGSATDASEADLAVLERQLATREALAPEEAAVAIRINTREPVLPATWRMVIRRLRLRVDRT